VSLEETRLGGRRALVGGDGDDVLVFLHGGGGLHRDPSVELLAGDLRIVAPELPGFSAGEDDGDTSSFDAIAEWVVAALDEAHVETFTLAGVSFGAVLALHLALAHPDRVDALVLLAPAAFQPEDWRLPDLDGLDRALFAHPGPRPEPPDEATFGRRAEILGRLVGGLDRERLRARIAAIDAPTLVVFGTEDGLIPPEMGREYRAAMPTCSLVYLYDAAHELGWDRPDALAELVGDFARRREAFVVGA